MKNPFTAEPKGAETSNFLKRKYETVCQVNRKKGEGMSRRGR